ncbi:DNA cytosine methyltransferase [Gracilibacillus oryzae]|uniref:DNA (cytosine-5-)-methyltransferase n=1 Tax=Gracilibacillus oryzae TaxID=1672701 RepID=A0A7C8KMW9_9BACI|nr:DNA cytosine methyltransferase [Gracilibacillus oryzae]KAB8126925.1 DNA cytosine methyltransferase [Gracilibacillus oryzae]
MKLQLDLFREIIVDNFAGGGGASTGIELATGLNVDVAINHDPAAIAMHKANHPNTEHYCESVWDIDPKEVVKGRKVGLCWLSPDCKHFSKAKGGKPVDKTIRGLAWIAVNWAIKVRPRVIMLENVEEFKTWGPLKRNDKGEFVPDPDKKGMTFQSFMKSLQALGYEVETKELKACDFGAPTTRKRLFLIARCDGQPISWPEPTHGDTNELNVQLGIKKPYRTAAEIIDWSINAPSIFERKKPLAENTMRRIARGIQRFVVNDPNPYIVRIGQTGFGKDRLQYKADHPLTTITTKAEHCLVTPFLSTYYTETTENGVRGQSIKQPIATIPTANRFGLISAFIAKNYGGNYNGPGIAINGPLHTITVKDHHSLVQAFLMKYYGSDTGQSLNGPLHTVTTKDRFGLVTVAGQDYRIVDIGMRMLQPHELFKAQGFPDEYIIDRDHKGNKYPKTQQVARCGNSVPPPFAEALVRSNLPELCVKSYKYKAAQ